MTRPSVAVVEAVADREGVRPSDLDCVLADAIDPTALDALLESSPTGTQGLVRFRYCEYVVTVRADSTVDIEPVE